MAFGGFESGTAQPMSEINTTPLVDVMLVLLIIFMICAPLMTQSITVNLPKAVGTTTEEKPEAESLSINAQGQVEWNGKVLDNDALLLQQLAQLSAKQPQPELHLLADKNVRYERVAQVMAMVREAGVTRMGFVMLPGAASVGEKSGSE
ncbi:MAG TPA: biopolymer transporter ExbD [Pseudomonadales bacterium]|jgi:biopolymer transport protein ExbD|nr:biopolymer transporter ExbD [Pseudomonadales bacterium]HNI38209.1 biopolymer transporter ExbD [Pseudomonadales bacterium]HNL91728.1 biopolymer transporter ExbD [Pseudomonadales bacterium]HNN86075.1 biopolymer transporter ExbD [Pseudomonadales bacterium]